MRSNFPKQREKNALTHLYAVKLQHNTLQYFDYRFKIPYTVMLISFHIIVL